MSVAPHFAEYRGVRALVVGGTGFVGRWVARELCACGADVVIAVRDLQVATEVCADFGIRAEKRQLDLSRQGSALQLVRSLQPSITFNLAGYGVDRSEKDEGLAWRLNAKLPQELCLGLAEGRDLNWDRQVLVHAGTAAEYGAARGNLEEGTPPSPTTLYGRTKLEGTRLLSDRASERGVRTLVARLFTVYGPGEHAGRLLPSLLEIARTGARLPLTDGTQRRDFTFVQDVALGMLRLGLVQSERDPRVEPPIVNLATGRLSSVREFVLTAAGVLGLPPDRLGFGELAGRTEEMEHDEVAILRLRGLVGWAPETTIAEGVRRTKSFEAGSDA